MIIKMLSKSVEAHYSMVHKASPLKHLTAVGEYSERLSSTSNDNRLIGVDLSWRKIEQ